MCVTEVMVEIFHLSLSKWCHSSDGSESLWLKSGSELFSFWLPMYFFFTDKRWHKKTCILCFDQIASAWRLVRKGMKLIVFKLSLHWLSHEHQAIFLCYCNFSWNFQLAASRSLFFHIEDANFLEHDFLDLMPICWNLCFDLIEEVQEFDSKVHVILPFSFCEVHLFLESNYFIFFWMFLRVTTIFISNIYYHLEFVTITQF